MNSTVSYNKGASPVLSGLLSRATVLAFLLLFATSASLAGEFNGLPTGVDFSTKKKITMKSTVTVLLGKVVTKKGVAGVVLQGAVEKLGCAMAKKYKHYLKKHRALGTFDIVIIAHFKKDGTNSFVHKVAGAAKPFGPKLASVFAKHTKTLAAAAGHDMVVRIPLRIIGPKEAAFHKGPFVAGSAVVIQPLDGTGQPAGLAVQTHTMDDLGRFRINQDHRGLVAITGNGAAWNESTGAVEGPPLTLQAYYDLGADEPGAVHVNVVTHVTYRRVEGLMNIGQSYETASHRAEAELHAALNLKDYDVRGVDMDLLDSNSSSDRLLLLSATITHVAQTHRSATGNPAALQALLDQLATDLADDGELSALLVAELTNARSAVDLNAVTAQLCDYVTTHR